jgi:hypothetical protein
LVLTGALYRPIQFLAQNAWDIDSALKPVAIGIGVAMVGAALTLLLARFGLDARAAGLGVMVATLVLFYWEEFDSGVPYLALLTAVIVVVVASRLIKANLANGLMLLVLAVLAGGSLAQLALSYAQQTTPYPIVRSPNPGEVSATGAVEDVVVLIVDTYPSPVVAEDWLGHDMQPLLDSLDGNGFVTPDFAWSQLTFTQIAVPSILELRPVAVEGPLPPWENMTSVHDVLGGDSVVANALRSSGFRYTHVESGLSGMECGPNVDHCEKAAFVDEVVWLVTEKSVAARPMQDRWGYYSAPSTLHAAEVLTSITQELIGDGVKDYLFGHLFIPHPPLVVDESCQVLDAPVYGAESDDKRTDPAYLATFSGQLSCVDSVVAGIAASAQPSTAFLITADHGTGFGGQTTRYGAEWSDLDIAERLSILVSYRMPEECSPPLDVVNIDVMRAIISCATDVGMPPRDTTTLLGADDPFLLDPVRLATIRAEVESGALRP